MTSELNMYSNETSVDLFSETKYYYYYIEQRKKRMNPIFVN